MAPKTQPPPIHGADHAPGGPDPVTMPGGASFGFPSPLPLPILTSESGIYDGLNWTKVEVDPTVRFGAVRTNSYSGHTPAINDYLTINMMLGPKGSSWGLNLCYRAGPSCGKITFALASIETPNPNTGVEGSLTTNALTYVTCSDPFDTYSATTSDTTANNYAFAFRITGDEGDPLTAFTGGFATMDGGPGMYALRVKVTDKHASSSGYRVDLTALTFWRLTGSGFYGGT